MLLKLVSMGLLVLNKLIKFKHFWILISNTMKMYKQMYNLHKQKLLGFFNNFQN